MAEVTFTPNHMPPPACYPSDFNGLLDELTTGGGLTGTIPDTAGGGVFVGSAAPPSALTNKVWFKTDAAARPLGVYMFYNGNWRKVYTGVGLGEIRMWSGSFPNFFDSTGRGIIAGDLDGWALCNGNNGTPNLEGYFPCAGVPGTQAGLPDGTWATSAEGGALKQTGGQRARVQLTINNMPPLFTKLFHAGGHWAGGTGGGNLVVPDSSYPDTGVDNWPVTDAAGNHPQSVSLPFQHLYIALAFIMFVGYQ